MSERSKLAKAVRYFTDRTYRTKRKMAKGAFDNMPDEAYICQMFRLSMGYDLNLQAPKTFNEKLQWLKLYDRKDIYTTMVDKYEAKQYVTGRIGGQYIIPTLGVWDRPEDIDFEDLPEQFVLKTTHDSHEIVICRDKNTFDRQAALRKMENGLKRDYYLRFREWPYKNVKHRVIAEQYMEDESGELQDYKIHIFNGVPRLILVCRDRFSGKGMTEDFFDEDWNHLDVKRPDAALSDRPIPRPERLEEMLALSKKLAEGLRFVRTDFYIVKGKIYFGEITFFPASGIKGFIPESFDRTMGDWLDLS